MPPNIELLSPTSEAGVELIKNDFYPEKNILEVSERPAVLTYITDTSGIILSSNSKSVPKGVDIFSLFCPESNIKTIFSKNIQLSENVFNGRIDKFMEHYVHVKLQRFTHEHDDLLLWNMTKAYIRHECHENDFKVILDKHTLYIYKLNLIFGLDSKLNIYKFTSDLDFLSSDGAPSIFNNVFNVPDDLISTLFSPYQRADLMFSQSFDDLSLMDRHAKKRPIYTGQTYLKRDPSKHFSIKIFDSIPSKNNTLIFPCSAVFESSSSQEPSLLKHNNILSKSDHSLVLLSKDADGFDVVIKKSFLHNHVEHRFYRYLCENTDGCENIERPLKIDADENLLVFAYNPNCVDLFEYIETHPNLKDSEIIDIFSQICAAVQFLHEHGIVHRDIKDENILIDTRGGKVKLIDFGTAAFISDNNGNLFKEYVGTFAYAPVEALRGLEYDGFKQDIWCLGIVLYTLAYGCVPFNSAKEAMQGFLRLPIPRPPELVSLLRKMLDPKPENRPSIDLILSTLYLIK